MEAVFYDHFRTKPWMQEIDLPTLEGQSVLLQIKASGLCRSDWHGWMGHDPDIRLPHVPGHEFSGVIVEVGTDVRRWRKGQRVTAPFIQACGTCSCCQRNDQQVCINQEQAGFSYWGSFAPHMVLRYADQNLVSVPDNVSFEAAALLGCRFGTAFRAICRQAQVVRGQSVIIFGAGGLGLSALLICKALGSKVCVVDPNEDAIRFATQLGADLSVTNWSLEHKSLVREWSEGGVHVSLDAVGKSDVVNQGLTCLRRRGKHVQVGLLVGDPLQISAENQRRLVAYELEVMGSHGLQAHQYKAMYQFIDRSRIDLSQLITHRLSLKEAIDWFFRLEGEPTTGISVITEF